MSHRTLRHNDKVDKLTQVLWGELNMENDEGSDLSWGGGRIYPHS